MLAKDIQKYTISADAACALFMGTEKVRILDRRNFNRDVYSMIGDVVSYILSKINVEYIIKHVKREERPELPEEALREAVVNALVHRDYDFSSPYANRKYEKGERGRVRGRVRTYDQPGTGSH